MPFYTFEQLLSEALIIPQEVIEPAKTTIYGAKYPVDSSRLTICKKKWCIGSKKSKHGY